MVYKVYFIILLVKFFFVEVFSDPQKVKLSVLGTIVTSLKENTSFSNGRIRSHCADSQRPRDCFPTQFFFKETT